MKASVPVLLIWILLCPLLLLAQPDSISLGVTLSDHPRLLLPKAEEQLLLKAIQSDSTLARIHQGLIAQCDSLVPIRRTALSALRVERFQDRDVREALRRLFVLSYGWRLTGKETYFQRAKSELWHTLILAQWNRERLDVVAQITVATSLAFDWLYPNLTPKERIFVQKTIAEKGLQAIMAPSDSSWTPPTDTQKQMANTALAYGALAIYESKLLLAHACLNQAIRSTDQLLALYAPHGAYPYGYSAWSDATNFTALLISALQKEFKTDFGLLKPTGFVNTSAYGLQMRAPSGRCFNYGESSLAAPVQPSLFWLARLPNTHEFGAWERNWFSNQPVASWQHEALLPAILLWSYDQTWTKPLQPPTKVWFDNGAMPVASLRSSWSDPQPLFIGLKAGSPSLRGAHMDVGSFIIEAQGERWGIDLGYQNTDSLVLAGTNMHDTGPNAARWLVFRNSNMAHSTLTANYLPQSTSGYASIISSSDQPSFLNAVTDLKELYPDLLVSAKRGVAIIDNQYLLVQDEVETGEKETILRWAMVTAAQIQVIDDQQIVLQQSGKQLGLVVDSSVKVKMQTWSTGPRYEYDSTNAGTLLIGFEVKVPPHTKQSWRVRLLPGTNGLGAPSSIIPLSDWPHN
ncbi:heparinase II/III domain-containing protein [Spirosoma aerolatum]|uniref:heparinase II/III domain-containing protein n=1 Tax=Spirosoma aerolatum TaxID=1211326 RepID=UPI0009AE9830|nr:heparinase II/III family protein [Spirosoma aerolatum]